MSLYAVLRTPLFKQHQASKLVDFCGWDMPIAYNSQVYEHNKVRESVGMFDVSHMCILDVMGSDAKNFLRSLVVSDIAKLTSCGSAVYTVMLNNDGGILDDMIIYLLSDNKYRIILNACTRSSDINWIYSLKNSYSDLNFDLKEQFSIIALQGPESKSYLTKVFDIGVEINDLKPFNSILLDSGKIHVARTGYTGEDGFEIIIEDPNTANSTWETFIELGVTPCGLGARDTLRLEASLNLYGSDMNENSTPYETNLSWLVQYSDDRNFIGSEALKARKIESKLCGFVFSSAGAIPRHGNEIIMRSTKDSSCATGLVTSGVYSPTLKQGICMATMPIYDYSEYKYYLLNKGREFEARMVKMPFVRNGTKVYKELF